MSTKKALLIGFNYSFLDPSLRLNGCVNDVRNMSALLQTKFGYKKEDVTVITDDDARTLHKCTNIGVILAIQELCAASWKQNLTEVYFHYSGHGSQTQDANGDELDGMDEGIVAFDYQKSGLLLDDYLRSLFKNFNPKTRVICTFDCCHSGSILDLKYVYDAEQKTEDKSENDPSMPLILMFSGCRDTQTSLDVHEVTGAAGALTTAISKILRVIPGSNPIDLQNNVNASMKSRKFTQFCMLSCSKNMSVQEMKAVTLFL